jgi:large subunit ribosomal protein L27e
LNGRFAGKKAVIVRILEKELRGKREPGKPKKKEVKFRRALIAGVKKYPKKVTNSMGKKKIAKKSSLKVFVKAVNLAHVLPTRLYCVLFCNILFLVILLILR